MGRTGRSGEARTPAGGRRLAPPTPLGLGLSLAATRLADRADAVPDEIWDEATHHFDEKGLAAIVLMIATTNLFNRLNATIKEQAGAIWG